MCSKSTFGTLVQNTKCTFIQTKNCTSQGCKIQSSGSVSVKVQSLQFCTLQDKGLALYCGHPISRKNLQDLPSTLFISGDATCRLFVAMQRFRL